MFKKIINKYTNDLRDRIDELESDINRYKKRLGNYEERNIKRVEDCAQLHRILENCVITKIAYENKSEYLTPLSHNREEFCLLYKDGKEYSINGLRLYNPAFTERNDSNRNVMFVKDSVGAINDYEIREYLIDLDKCTYIRQK
ncbi:MAG: hypothetical protein E6357_26320 [Clostridiales bacterium]|nr:hypothetical protein [Clostridiales bacterium]